MSYQTLNKFLKVCLDIADYANESQKEQENQECVNALCECTGFMDGFLPTVIREGVRTVVALRDECEKAKDWNEYYKANCKYYEENMEEMGLDVLELLDKENKEKVKEFVKNEIVQKWGEKE